MKILIIIKSNVYNNENIILQILEFASTSAGFVRQKKGKQNADFCFTKSSSAFFFLSKDSTQLSCVTSPIRVTVVQYRYRLRQVTVVQYRYRLRQNCLNYY
jgi:hypothetical protein